jgi:large subunit ribosomal protein L9
MKVILLMDVARLGRRFEIKDVPDGHALNFLIPRKLAEPATKENVKRHEERMKKAEADRAHTDEALHETLSKLKDAEIVMKVPANEQGHLFKGIKAADVAAYVAKEVGPLSEEHLSLKTPIKETGEYDIVATAGKQHASFKLKVEQA